MADETTGASSPDRAAPARRAAAYVSSLKIPVALLCLFGVALAGYYFVYVRQQTRYVTGRNFRVLATIGEQMQASVDNARTVVLSFLRDPNVFEGNVDLFGTNGCQQAQQSFGKIAADFVPVLRSIQIDRWNCRADQTLSVRFVERGGRTHWTSGGSTGTAGSVISLSLTDVLGPVLEGEIQEDLFASVALTTAAGRVILQTGDPHLRVVHFGDLLAQADASKAPVRTFASLSSSPTVADVEVAGSRYTLFIQPCCLNMAVTEESPPGEEAGWVLSALIPTGDLRRQGLAFPVAAVVALSAVLLFAVFAWPFLKLMLIGDRQRIRIYDVMLVGVCGLLGLSLLTLGALDLYAYKKLKSTLDGQLEALAASIRQQTSDEANAAYEQLKRLEQLAFSGLPDRRHRLAETPGITAQDLGVYPFFSSFAMIDAEGMQQKKWTLASFLTPFVRVNDREYFRHWAVNRPDEAFFLESIRSKTTGLAEAILSKPVPRDATRPPSGPDKRSLTVSAITIPLRALLAPVTVPGFGFAVIDDAGRVLFHSDSEHNLSESFIAETDGSRRLRALVVARHEELLDLKYWGADHRAFVTPMGLQGMPWTLVTFYDKQLVRTVNMEALIGAVFYALVYGAVFALVAVAILLFQPTYRAPWIWPDASHATTYLRLTLSHAALVAAFVVALAAFSPGRLLLTAWLLPLLACSLTILVLRAEGRSVPRTNAAAVVSLFLLLALLWTAGSGWTAMAFDAALAAGCLWAFRLTRPSSPHAFTLAPPLNLSYGIAAATFVLLTTLLPAAGFFAVAHGIHTQNFVKYGQLSVAQSLAVRQERRNRTAEHRIVGGGDTAVGLRNDVTTGRDGGGVYYGFFFGTEPATCPEPSEQPRAGAVLLLPALLEELLPYYSESSVSLRELMHGRADDGSWTWHLDGGGLLLCMARPFAGEIRGLRSGLVPLVGDWPPGDVLVPLLLLAGIVIVTAAAAYVVRFIMRRIFVVELIEPLWSGRGTVLPAAKRPELIVLDAGHTTSRFFRPARYHVIDLEDAGTGAEAQRAWFEGQVDRLAQVPADSNVLILHFEHDMTDTAFNDHKLSFVEEVVLEKGRTVAIMSGVPPERLFASPAATADEAMDASSASRWASLRSTCSVIPAGPPSTRLERQPERPHLDWQTTRLGELLWRLNTLRFSRQTAFLDREQRDPFVASQWNQVLPFAWQADDRAPLDLEQLLIEVGDRTENYYQAMWQSCSVDERLVLEQVATERLVNQKSSRTVRVLMAKGFVERRPHFDVMCETFRRFVSSGAPDREAEELEAERSTWDSVRLPFWLLVGSTAAVFFTTQQELFQQTVGIAAAVAATLPTLVRVASLVSGKTGSSGG